MTSFVVNSKSKLKKCIVCNCLINHIETCSSTTNKHQNIILKQQSSNNSQVIKNDNNNYINEILPILAKYFSDSLEPSTSHTVFCVSCKNSLIKLKNLHVSLEKVQAEITRVVKSISAKINNSGAHTTFTTTTTTTNSNNNKTTKSTSSAALSLSTINLPNTMTTKTTTTTTTSHQPQLQSIIIKNDNNVDALLQFQDDEIISSTKAKKISRSTNICQRFNPEINLFHLNRIDEKSDPGQHLDDLDEEINECKATIVKSEENISDFHSGLDDDHCYLDVKLETGDVEHENFGYLEDTYWNNPSSEETFEQNNFMDMNDEDGQEESYAHLNMKTELLDGFHDEEVLGMGPDPDFMEQYAPLESIGIPGLDLSDPEQLSNFTGLKRQDSANNDPRRTIACSQPGCYKMFPNHHALKKHQKTHAPRTFICNLCSKSFVENSKLKRHKLVHTKVKPFKCNFEGCGKQFSLDFNLRTHMRIHSDERPYVCPYAECGRKFVQSTNLKSHLLTHNKIKNSNKKSRSRNEEFVTDIEVQLMDMNSESD